ncbi:hypothetical protein OOT46_07245 [Aquabacterium sp. A7-Y]|uniref:hypothetical protein n=1 Tax=Aquabacterium sp. A7-Y TaxID=1349605 RepID=UPI00223E8DF3|nr:hypothetical protein [Aquabacterium sp. A7-Y]MCW7537646.1 hypothetical protein [Aquabacterium sp. A7-Y]
MNNPLTRLENSLAACRRGELPVHQFVPIWRDTVVQLSDLPPRYREVLEGLLMQLESGSLFTEESCSFSQQDLMNKLATWLDKARQQLA